MEVEVRGGGFRVVVGVGVGSMIGVKVMKYCSVVLLFQVLAVRGRGG